MPRFIVDLPMSFRCHATATDSAAAIDKARQVMMNTDFATGIKKALPFDVNAQVTFGGTPKVEGVSVDDLNKIDDPAERLHAVYVRCFKHSGPRMPYDDVTAAIARTAYKAMPEGPDKLRAHAAFNDFSADLGVVLCTPAIFTGEWFGYEHETYALGIRGYDNGQRWNGWACPLLSLEGMKAIVDWQNKQDKESLVGIDQVVITKVDRVSKVWMQYSADNGGERVEILPSTYQTKDGAWPLYTVGDGWCWEVFASKRDAKFKKLAG